MIIAHIVFFAIGIAAFFLMAKFGMPIRLVAALALFLIPSIDLTLWVVRIGDNAAPDAVTIVPKHSETPGPVHAR